MSDQELNNTENEPKQGELILYQTEDGQNKINVTLLDETVWLTQGQMGDLFQTTKQNISLHINNIFEEKELSQNSVVKEYLTTASDGKNYKTLYYNLDVIISVGYRVRSLRGTQFRIWATERLKEYIIKGFTMNDDLLKNGSKNNYFEELLARIRDIRSSELVFYRKVLDIFSTSIDYNASSDICIEFFKTIQNKFHYAAHGHTASEIICERSNASKINMGLTSFKGKNVTKQDTHSAKNYLSEEELDRLNRMVTIYLEFAELQAMGRKPMYMKDHLSRVDEILKMTGGELLNHAGSKSHEQAVEQADKEYETYKKEQQKISKAERDMLKQLESTAKKLEKKNKEQS